MTRQSPSVADEIDRSALSELDRVRDSVTAHPEYLDQTYVAEVYRQNGCVVEPGRWHAQSERIKRALATGQPLSIIRIGDGEVHLLASGDQTPNLDRYLLARVLDGHSDTVPVTDEWAVTLREWMERSIRSADVVGVRGIDPSGGIGDVAARLAAIERDPRGGVGVFRAIAVMLKLARNGDLAGKVIASAHLYFGVLQRLDRLIGAAEAVVLVRSRASVAQELARRYAKPFILIETGKRDEGTQGEFLQRVERALPSDLAGHLCLIGAGVWSEFYCDWAKRRGGVALDIGSGFDLLAGEQTRPIHRRILPDVDAMRSIRVAIDGLD